MEQELSEGAKEHIAYEVSMDNFFKTNYSMLLATFLDDNHDRFMEHVVDCHDDHRGEPMKWVWATELLDRFT